MGSLYHGFPGFLDQVRLSSGVLEFRRIRVEPIFKRASFVRMESPATLQFAVTNLQSTPPADAEVEISLGGVASKTSRLRDLPPGKPAVVDYPLDTSLRPDAYRVACCLRIGGPAPYQSREESTVRIVARPAHRFPVLMWGVCSPEGVLKEMGRLKHIGFNHVLGIQADNQKIWDAGRPTEAGDPDTVVQTNHMLDEALANEMTIVASLSPGESCSAKRAAFQRVDRDGQPQHEGTRRLRADAPRAGLLLQRGRVGGADLRRVSGVWRGPAAHRGCATTPRSVSTRTTAKRSGRLGHRHSGRGVVGPLGDRLTGKDHRLPGRSRDSRRLSALRLLSLVLEGGRRLERPEHGPAPRPEIDRPARFLDLPRPGRAGGAACMAAAAKRTCLSQWTYSYPDPIRIAVATDELLAMAGGASTTQNVMKMTQIIWYRSQTAPIPKKPAEAPALSGPLGAGAAGSAVHHHRADAPARGVLDEDRPADQGHHVSRLAIARAGRAPGGYCFTHPETRHELARLIREVIQPLGPTLLQTPGAKSDVAFLESFAAEMFARRGTYGWGGSWLGDAYHVLLYAHLQPEIVFDETISSRGLDGFRVLVMADCDVITAIDGRADQGVSGQGRHRRGRRPPCPGHHGPTSA